MTIGAEQPHLFSPMLNTMDMVACRKSDVTLEEINDEAAKHGLRFPLIWDPAASIAAHIASVDFAPASARFGSYVDNVVGMNWKLPSGTVVKVGERVIKSTTGYDLMRFLLHSDGRYGRALDYVLRLRPLGGETVCVQLDGSDAAIESARRALLTSPWIHWIDAVDLLVTDGELPSLRLEAEMLPGESVRFLHFFRQISCESGTAMTEHNRFNHGGLPQLSIKSTVSNAPLIGRDLVSAHGGRVRILCVNGVVGYYPPPGLTTLPPAFLTRLAQACTSLGGHLHGPLAPVISPSAAEATWAQTLESAWNPL
jgi:hypothetical protein